MGGEGGGEGEYEAVWKGKEYEIVEEKQTKEEEEETQTLKERQVSVALKKTLCSFVCLFFSYRSQFDYIWHQNYFIRQQYTQLDLGKHDGLG